MEKLQRTAKSKLATLHRILNDLNAERAIAEEYSTIEAIGKLRNAIHAAYERTFTDFAAEEKALLEELGNECVDDKHPFRPEVFSERFAELKK